MNEEISIESLIRTGKRLVNLDGAARITYFLLRIVAGGDWSVDAVLRRKHASATSSAEAK